MCFMRVPCRSKNILKDKFEQALYNEVQDDKFTCRSYGSYHKSIIFGTCPGVPLELKNKNSTSRR